MVRIRKERVITKMGMENIMQGIEEEQLRWNGHAMRLEDCRIARQVVEWTPQRKGGEADQSTYGRVGLEAVCKE
jgi:hypothetical protein